MQGVVGTELRKVRAELILFRCIFVPIISIIAGGWHSNRGRGKGQSENVGRLIFTDRYRQLEPESTPKKRPVPGRSKR